MTPEPHHTHINRGNGWERITRREPHAIHTMPHFATRPERVPHAAIVQAATITHLEHAQYEQEVAT